MPRCAPQFTTDAARPTDTECPAGSIAWKETGYDCYHVCGWEACEAPGASVEEFGDGDFRGFAGGGRSRENDVLGDGDFFRDVSF